MEKGTLYLNKLFLTLGGWILTTQMHKLQPCSNGKDLLYPKNTVITLGGGVYLTQIVLIAAKSL